MLEFNVCAQAESLAELNQKIEDQITTMLEMASELNVGLEQLIKPADDRYFEMYRKAIPLEYHVNESVAKLFEQSGYDADGAEVRMFEQTESTLSLASV